MGQAENKEPAEQKPAEHKIKNMLKRRLSMSSDNERPPSRMPKPVKLKGHPGMDSLDDNP